MKLQIETNLSTNHTMVIILLIEIKNILLTQSWGYCQ